MPLPTEASTGAAAHSSIVNSLAALAEALAASGARSEQYTLFPLMQDVVNDVKRGKGDAPLLRAAFAPGAWLSNDRAAFARASAFGDAVGRRLAAAESDASRSRCRAALFAVALAGVAGQSRAMQPKKRRTAQDALTFAAAAASEESTGCAIPLESVASAVYAAALTALTAAAADALAALLPTRAGPQAWLSPPPPAPITPPAAVGDEADPGAATSLLHLITRVLGDAAAVLAPAMGGSGPLACVPAEHAAAAVSAIARVLAGRPGRLQAGDLLAVLHALGLGRPKGSATAEGAQEPRPTPLASLTSLAERTARGGARGSAKGVAAAAHALGAHAARSVAAVRVLLCQP